MNVYEAIVPENAPAQRLENYLSRAFPLLPPHVIRNALAKKDVKQNGQRCTRDSLLLPGARVQLYTPHEAAIPVVYEDEHILLLHKPAGISCDEDSRGGMTVLTVTEKMAAGAYTPRLCHRLDNQTSGLLLLAKDDESEQILLEAFENHTLEKVYECLVRGQMRPEKAVMKAYLIKDAARATVRVITHETPSAMPIETMYETLSFDGTLSKLRVTLLTGRTHQIRVHMSYKGHPLLGDTVYGHKKDPFQIEGQALHAGILGFTHPTTGEYMEFSAPLPTYFTELIEKLKTMQNR